MPGAGITTLGFLLEAKNTMKLPTATTSKIAPTQIAPVAMLDRSWALAHWRAAFALRTRPNWPAPLEHAATMLA
jgi:hypothetical protein